MKFSCDQERLNAALAIVIRSVATKNANPALEGILIEVGRTLRLTGYNQETAVVVEVPAEIEEMGSLVLDAKLFSNIVRKLPRQVIQITQDQYWVKITCSASDFLIMGTDATDFPELPQVSMNQGLVMNQNTLKNMIGNTHFAISANEGRRIHTGSLFEVSEDSLTLVSLDGFRMAVRRENIDKVYGGPSFSFVVPGMALSEVEKICNGEEEISIYQSDKHIIFSMDHILYLSRRIEGEFLDYKGAIPQDNPYGILVSRRELSASIDRVSLMINEKAKAPLRFLVGDQMIEMSSKTSVGEATEVCAMTGNGEGTEMGFNHRYLHDALRHAPSGVEKVRMVFSSPNQPCLILPETVEDDSFCYMVLPVRLKS